jgi:hypothetical protein
MTQNHYIWSRTESQVHVRQWIRFAEDYGLWRNANWKKVNSSDETHI